MQGHSLVFARQDCEGAKRIVVGGTWRGGEVPPLRKPLGMAALPSALVPTPGPILVHVTPLGPDVRSLSSSLDLEPCRGLLIVAVRLPMTPPIRHAPVSHTRPCCHVVSCHPPTLDLRLFADTHTRLTRVRGSKAQFKLYQLPSLRYSAAICDNRCK
jgi:hypothetical protein